MAAKAHDPHQAVRTSKMADQSQKLAPGKGKNRTGKGGLARRQKIDDIVDAAVRGNDAKQTKMKDTKGLSKGTSDDKNKKRSR